MKRTVKRILSTLLIAVMLIGIAPIGGIDFAPKASAKDISSCSVGDTITYGSYPQSKVTDSTMLSALESATKTWISYNYYSGTESLFDGQMKASDYMQYADIVIASNKYRAVKLTNYRSFSTGFKSSAEKSYQDDNGYTINAGDTAGTVYYFKYEPLTWRVLDPSEGYVMCNQIIDSQAYQNFVYKNGTEYYNSLDCAVYASDWVTSSLREWLNNDFYNTAFTADERAQIGKSYLENKSKYNSTCDSAETWDYIFPISYDDAINSAYGFSSDRTAYDTARQLKGTDYAKCQGLRSDVSNGNSWWWLRSPYNSSGATEVSDVGGAYNYSCYVGMTDGVIPAFKFNPNNPYEISVSYETYDGVWAKGYQAPTNYMSNKTLALPTKDNITKTGYTFGGWVKTTVDNDPTKELYTAQWTANKYTLTFALGNGENDVTITQDYGTTVTAPTPTKTGYTFKGWDKTVPTTVPAENATYTAQWEECDHSGNTNPTSCAQETICSVCSGTIAADPHSYGSDWKYDETDHWHECVNGCGAVTDKANHTFEWVTDKEPTESETGVAHEECTVCHATRNENTVVERNKTKWEKMYDCFISFIAKIISKIFKFFDDVC